MKTKRFGGKHALAFALFACAWLFFPASAVPQEIGGSPMPSQSGLSVLWQRSVDPLLTLNLSPQGKRLALITAGGRLALWDADTGKSQWALNGVTAHDAVASDQLGGVLVYDDMNRIDRRLTLYRAPETTQAAQPALQSPQAANTPLRGSSPPPAVPARPKTLSMRATIAFTQVLSGAIWNAAVSVDGATAACVTGDRKLHLITLGRQPSLSTISLDGIGSGLEFSGDNQFVAVGLWDNSGVETVDMAGRIRWSYLGAISRRYDIAVSPDNRRVLSISYRNPNHTAPVLTLLNEQGAVLWTFPLDSDAYGAYARLGPNAEITYVSYTAIVRHYRETVLERRLAAVGPSGDVLWRQGGLFFKPTLLFVTPAGDGVVVYDGVQTLYRLDKQGQVVRRDRLPGQLESWTVNHDRTRLVIYTSDGELTSYKVR